MWLKLLWSIFGLLCSTILEPVVSRDDSSNVLVSLYKSLFEGNYTSAVRPYCSAEAVNVTIDVGLREIVDLSEKQETIKLKIWVRLYWEDCYLTWNKSEFGNISKLVVPYEKIWIPDVTLLEGINEIANMPDMKQYRTWITNHGEIEYHFPTTVHMACGMNIAKFPFDYQICTMTFGSWIHTNSEIEMFSKSDTGDLASFLSDQEWIVVSLQATKFRNPSSCCNEPFSAISYRLVIKRKATFYIMIMIVPFVALNLVSIAGFLLPPSSNERITFHVDILLSVIVFLLLIHDTLPSSSEFFPNIGIYFTITLILMCISCVMSVIIIYLHDPVSKKKNMSRRIRKFESILNGLLHVKCNGKKPVPKTTEENNAHMIEEASTAHGTEEARSESQGTQPDTSQDLVSQQSITPPGLTGVVNTAYENDGIELQHQNANIPIAKETNQSVPSEAKQMNEWEMLAYTLDRFFAFLYIFLTILNNSIFAILLSQNNEP